MNHLMTSPHLTRHCCKIVLFYYSFAALCATKERKGKCHCCVGGGGGGDARHAYLELLPLKDSFSKFPKSIPGITLLSDLNAI